MLPQDPIRSVLLQQLEANFSCQADLDLYDSPQCDRLATQVAQGRFLCFIDPDRRLIPTDSTDPPTSFQVQLCEDDYLAWLKAEDLAHISPVTRPYQPQIYPRESIRAAIPAVIAFVQQAQRTSDRYLWGGTVGPNYDCSGLVQAAFVSQGIWLPRDAYQQEAFVAAIALTALEPGDLIFFGPPAKATHVALYLGDQAYIHSSGQEHGHDGIAIDYLDDRADCIGQYYRRQIRGAGRVMTSYLPRELNL